MKFSDILNRVDEFHPRYSTYGNFKICMYSRDNIFYDVIVMSYDKREFGKFKIRADGGTTIDIFVEPGYQFSPNLKEAFALNVERKFTDGSFGFYFWDKIDWSMGAFIRFLQDIQRFNQ